MDNAYRIGDFGTAKALEDTNIMNKSVVKGTLLYMPPEVLGGNTDFSIEGDAYSFGVFLIELWNERKPFSECSFQSDACK